MPRAPKGVTQGWPLPAPTLPGHTQGHALAEPQASRLEVQKPSLHSRPPVSVPLALLVAAQSLLTVVLIDSGFPGGSVVENRWPTQETQETQETQVQALGQEDPLEEGVATPPVFLPGESRGQRSLAGDSPQGLQRVRHN